MQNLLPKVWNIVKGSWKNICKNWHVVQVEVDEGRVEPNLQAPDHVPGENQVGKVAQVRERGQSLQFVVAQIFKKKPIFNFFK